MIALAIILRTCVGRRRSSISLTGFSLDDDADLSTASDSAVSAHVGLLEQQCEELEGQLQLRERSVGTGCVVLCLLQA